MTAEAALCRLKDGNVAYLRSNSYSDRTGPEIRLETAENGQHPYAVILGCADSRAIPELIFHAGIGELFTIRSAGNVIGAHELGSMEYAVDHLGVKLIVVLGHTGCGAVAAALHTGSEGHVASILDEIRRAAGGASDPAQVCIRNIRRSVDRIRNELPLPDGVTVCGALCHLADGTVEFLDA